MHLLPISAQSIDQQDEAVDPGLAPRDIVFLSFTDSDLTAMAAAWRGGAFPSLTLADLKRYRHPMSVDLLVEQAVMPARFVLVRCLGGLDYWRYGIEEAARLCRERGAGLAIMAGDGQHDPRFAPLSTVPAGMLAHLDACFQAGGVANFRRALKEIADAIAHPATVRMERDAPEPLPPCTCQPPLGDPDGPAALVIGYRSAHAAGLDGPVIALAEALAARGFAAHPLFVTSLKDPAASSGLEAVISATRPAVILNTTAFSARSEAGASPLDAADCPVIQAMIAGSSRARWLDDPRGLSAADMAMNVVLPEFDGRIITRPIAFKAPARFDPELQIALAEPDIDAAGIAAVADRALRWAKLRDLPNRGKRLAIVLPDYPARGGRAGYAVGLDCGNSVARILAALAAEGYDAGDIPAGDALVARLEAAEFALPLDEAKALLARLPEGLRDAAESAWGKPEADPLARRGAFRYRALTFGKVLVALQPDRAEAANRKAAYHDATLPPRWSYSALFLLLQRECDALLPLGTHGALEWLPGKAMAPSPACWPAALAGDLPVIYPFIVNDPGEAATARRRLGAVTLGHLTPPLRPAGRAGAGEIETLLDEYAEAERLDPRRAKRLREAILAEARRTGLAEEAGADIETDPAGALARIDAWLCDIKELAIRDGQHVFGESPGGEAGEALAGILAEAASVPAGEARRRLRECGASEMRHLLAALAGRFVPAGPAGAPTRGRLDVLPTGRNLTGLDPRAMPTPTAWKLAEIAAEALLAGHLQREGEPLASALIDLWASPAFRTGGEDFALALHLLGARPVWDAVSGRVSGVEAIPIARLGRPRVDVTLRISGLFRDLFPDKIGLFDQAVRLVAGLDEDEADNPLRAADRLERIFGSRPGRYGADVARHALDGDWQERNELATSYLGNIAAFGTQGAADEAAGAAFAGRVAASRALIHSQDDRERDALDTDGVGDFVGGFAAAAGAAGATPTLYHLDTSRAEAPRLRTFPEEIARIVRGRIANPDWIAGQMRHGQRGAAEFAQAVDALFLFAATTEAVADRHFELVHAALIADPAVRDFILAHNPAAGRAMAERLSDAIRRGLWRPRRNAVAEELSRLLGLREAAE